MLIEAFIENVVSGSAPNLSHFFKRKHQDGKFIFLAIFLFNEIL